MTLARSLLASFCAIFILLSARGDTPVVRAGNCNHTIAQPIGVNTNYVQSYISSIHFGDLAKRCRPWKGMDPQTGLMNGGTVPRNSLGYPLVPSASRIFAQTHQVPLRGGLVSGDRVVLAYNRGTAATPGGTDVETVLNLIGVNIIFTGGTENPVTGDVRKYYSMGYDNSSVAKHVAQVDVLASQLNSIDLGNNGGEDLDFQLHVWIDENHEAAQAADPKEVFFDQYIARLTELNPAHIRTGPNWSRNNSAGSGSGGWTPDWSTRVLTSAYRWAEPFEVPWEVHCWLANKMQTDLWLCIPLVTFDPAAGATDADYMRAEDYTRQLARLVQAELDPNLHVIVEWSNEMWNTGFTTYNWISQLLENDPNFSPPYSIADRAQKAEEIIELTFGWWVDEFNDCRVEFAAMGNAANSTWVDTIGPQLAACNLVDAVGCSTYMQPLPNDEDDWLHADPNLPDTMESYDLIEASVDANLRDDTAGNTSFMRAHAQAAVDSVRPDGVDVRFYIYESGPHLAVPVSSFGMDGPPPNLNEVQLTYGGVQNTMQMQRLVTLMLNRFLLPFDANTNSDGVVPALPRLVDRTTYFAFCQTKDLNFGSFYLLEDLYANLLSGSFVHTQPQLKFVAVRDYILGW